MTDAPNRIIIVEDPEPIVSEHIEYAKEQLEQAKDNDSQIPEQIYWQKFLQYFTEHIEELQEDGLSEAVLVDNREAASERFNDSGNELTEETAEVAARIDANNVILESFFDYGEIEIEEVTHHRHENGTVLIQSHSEEPVRIHIRGEEDALEKAQWFRHYTNWSVDDLTP